MKVLEYLIVSQLRQQLHTDVRMTNWQRMLEQQGKYDNVIIQ
jgi:hypothetical protein